MKKIIQVLFTTFLITFLSAQFVVADGLLQVNDTEQYLYLSRSLVDVKIFDQIALTTVEHEFLNPVDADSVDVTFMFPLPDNAAVTNIAIWRGSLYVDFQLAASDSGGHQTLPGGNTDPDLLEYLKPNPFIIPVVARDDTVKIKLSYAELLPFDFGAIQYRYPLDSGQYSTGALDAFAILVTFATQRSLVDIRTPNFSSGIDIVDAFSATVGYDQAGLIATRDFIVDYKLAQEEVGLFTLTYRNPADTTETTGFFLALLEPGSVQPNEIINKHFMFVLDRSGSMQGGKIEQAKDAARYCIEHLNANDFFNIIDFSSDVRQYKNEPVKATPANIAEAVNYVNNISASSGTNINEAMLRALAQTSSDQLNQVIFLTDGQATAGETRTDRILENIRLANLNGASIFVFGVGDDVSKELLQAMADQNHGIATYIAQGEPIDNIIVNFFARISNPVLINVSLDYGELEVTDVYPVDLPDMFAGFQQVIAGRYMNSGNVNITLNGSVANADTAIIYPNVYFPDSSTSHVFIPKIWAKKKIDHLYTRWLKEGQPDELKQEIIALSLKYGVLSPFTRYDEPDPGGGMTGVEDLQFTALQIAVDLNNSQPEVVLQWRLTGDLSQVSEIEIHRATGASADFVRIANLDASAQSYADLTANFSQKNRYRVDVVLLNGERLSQTVEYSPQLIKQFSLGQNYPNPFNPTTKIAFFVPQKMLVKLTVYNLIGREVKVLTNEVLSAGVHEVTWDGKDQQGRSVASGLYFYQLKAATFSQTRKMMFSK